MMLKSGKYNTNNRQAVYMSWKWHHSWSLLDQSTYHFINYFHCNPASKWKCSHGQRCSS